MSTPSESTDGQPPDLSGNRPSVIGPMLTAGHVLGILPFRVTLRAQDGNAFPSQDIVLDMVPGPFLPVVSLSGHDYITGFPKGHENGVLGVGVLTEVLQLVENAPPVLRVGGNVAYAKQVQPVTRQVMEIWGQVTFYQT